MLRHPRAHRRPRTCRTCRTSRKGGSARVRLFADAIDPVRVLPHFPLRPLAAMWLTSLAVQAQPLWLKPDGALSQPQGDQSRQRPIVLRADRLSARPDLDALADGHVEYGRGGDVCGAVSL